MSVSPECFHLLKEYKQTIKKILNPKNTSIEFQSQKSTHYSTFGAHFNILTASQYIIMFHDMFDISKIFDLYDSKGYLIFFCAMIRSYSNGGPEIICNNVITPIPTIKNHPDCSIFRKIDPVIAVGMIKTKKSAVIFFDIEKCQKALKETTRNRSVKWLIIIANLDGVSENISKILSKSFKRVCQHSLDPKDMVHSGRNIYLFTK